MWLKKTCEVSSSNMIGPLAVKRRMMRQLLPKVATIKRRCRPSWAHAAKCGHQPALMHPIHPFPTLRSRWKPQRNCSHLQSYRCHNRGSGTPVKEPDRTCDTRPPHHNPSDDSPPPWRSHQFSRSDTRRGVHVTIVNLIAPRLQTPSRHYRHSKHASHHDSTWACHLHRYKS